MSEDRNHGEKKAERNHEENAGPHASEGGGARKWLIGAAAVTSAVLLLGAGYLAWRSFAPGQDRAQTAYNDPYASEPRPAGPVERDRRATTREGATDARAAAPASVSVASPPSESAASSASTETRRPAPARRSAARARTVPDATIVATPVNATGADSDEIVVTGTRRIWARVPSARRLAAYYPDRLLQRGREGEARLHCTVLAGGALDCTRVEETPGFGTAALRVARTLRHAPQRADGRDATGTAVNLRVVFRLSEEERRRG